MKRTLLELVALLVTANFTALSGQVSPGPTISGEHIALVGGTVINPADGKRLRKSVDHIKEEANEKHNQDVEKMAGSEPDQ